jgi:REP element-mobilizing transposase RayT
MSRGNAKQTIFRDAVDYERYLDLLEMTTARFDVRCASYCLMRNHLHLLLQPLGDPLCRMMQQLNSTYSLWFNKRHKRIGHVLQGRYRAQLIDSTSWFLRALRYIVRNPVDSGDVAEPSDWAWSSCRATVGLCEMPAFLDLRRLWLILGCDQQSGGAERISAYIDEKVDEDVALQRLLVGPKEFLEKYDPLLDSTRRCSDFTVAERFVSRPRLSELLPIWYDDRNNAIARAFYEHRYTLKEIADYVHRPVATVWNWIRRAKRLGSDLDFRKTLPAKPKT